MAQNGAAATLLNCMFIDNINQPSTTGSSAVLAVASLNQDAELFRDTEVWLQGCTFTSSTPPSEPLLLADVRNEEEFKAVIYSDDPSQTVCTLAGVWEWEDNFAECVVRAPEVLTTPGDQFLTNSSTWFVQTQQVGYQSLEQASSLCACFQE